MIAGAALPVLYSFRRCPYAMRARMAIAVSEQAVELREVRLAHKPQGLLDASPKGTVPVLVLPAAAGGAASPVLEQSLDIMLWALARHDPEAWLAPSNGDRADMRALIAECDGRFKQALDRAKYPNRYPECDALAERAVAAEWLRGLERRLAAQPCLFGRHMALADMAIAPFVRQFAGIDAAWWAAQPWPRLQAWLSGWQASELFARVMHKLPPWQDGTDGVRFPAPLPD